MRQRNVKTTLQSLPDAGVCQSTEDSIVKIGVLRRLEMGRSNRGFLWLLVLGVLFLLTGCTAKTESEQQVLAEFRLEEDSKLILLPVKLGENQYHFALDTGASNTVFDVSLKHRLGTEEKTTGVDAFGKTFQAQVFGAPDAFLGPFNLKDCGQVACIDLSSVSLSAGRSVHGIIGMDFLKKHLIQIDFDKATVSFLQPKRKKGFFSFLASKKRHDDDWGEKIAIRFSSLCIPSIKGTVDAQLTTYFQIDTGSAGRYLPNAFGNLESGLFDKVQSSMRFKSKGETQATAAGVVAVDFTAAKMVRTFAVGQLRYENAIFYQSDEPLLGLPFLSRHLVTFDFPGSQIYLKKRTMPKDRPAVQPTPKQLKVEGLGFVLRRGQDNVYVHEIDPNSLGYEEGIRKNDILLKVQDHDVASYDLLKIAHALAQRDRVILTLTFERGEEVKVASFELEQEDTKAEVQTGDLKVGGLDFTVRRNEHGPYVHSIDPNGPAYREGMRQNDIILKVCDRDVTSYSVAELASAFSQPGSETLTIMIQRANDTKKITFALETQDANDNSPD
jgi:hypothetical protein